MSDIAIHSQTGKRVHAYSFTANAWDELKQNYQVGEYIMDCCKTPAIPKTSINGVQFFAHLNDECTTAPETIWHSNAKELIQDSVQRHGVVCRNEVTGGHIGRRWKADVYFEIDQRRVAIEIQHSPQTLRVYLDRQRRYQDSGVECYWIVIHKQFMALSKAIWKHRVKNEFGGRAPHFSQISGCSTELPAVTLELDPVPRIKGPSLGDGVDKWIDSIIAGTFQWYKGVWIDLR